MTSINRTMYPLQSSFSSIKSMQGRLDQLQVQLGTGKKFQTLADYGNQRPLSLQVRERLSRIEGYTQNSGTVNLRLDMLDTVMTRLEKVETDTRGSAIVGGYGSDNLNLTNVPQMSKSRLDELVTLLNSQLAGRYLFGGSAADKPPVAGMDALLNGETGKAGFKQVVTERKLADAGADGLGRLDLTRVGVTVTLAEDGVHPFGYKLSTITTTSPGIIPSPIAGSPPSTVINVGGTVTAGETIDIGLTLPDGSSTSVKLTAVTGTPTSPGEFQIGVDAFATSANIEAALNTSLLELSKTELDASSTFAAAQNFFNGQGETVQRVNGPPFETATSLVAATSSNTVQWYRGSDTAGAPRDSVTAKVDDSTIVSYGVEANEAGFVNLMRSLAAMAVSTFQATDPRSHDRFDAVSRMQNDRLSEGHNSEPGSLELITLELGQARSAIGNAKDRNTAYKTQLDTMLADVEQVGVEEVAMELLAVKTRLEASYTTTAAMSQLSLVYFLR